MKIYVEGYGCSMNLAETEQIKGHAIDNGLTITDNIKDTDFIIINTCAVKGRTENRMISKIKKFYETATKQGKQLIVVGCLPKINPKAIEQISKDIISIGPDLKKLSQILGIEEQEFSPNTNTIPFNPHIAIIPIAKGCTNYCTFCGTKLARGDIQSYTIESIETRTKKALQTCKEIWLTGQDTGAYGLDIKSSLPKLIEKLLLINENYKIRIGMMNPHHLRRIYKELIPLFSDNRIYKFIHLPVQAGSDRILTLMRRGYTSTQYKELIEKLKKDIPEITIATDIIAGFPTETEKEFQETINLIKETKPDIVNISKFAPRPNTIAATMKQLPSKIIAKRTKRLTTICNAIAYNNNKKYIGKKDKAYFSEKGKNNTIVGRTSNYKPVVIEKGELGKFQEIEITDAYPHWLKGKIIENQTENKQEIKEKIVIKC
ncbi:MAG: tRNA (N(6)-L-threonylcarbamoyladenosine(37)-C(2))-methylthiotransferase [Candidatus Diapherotrites archaeon]